ncbi:MAG: radical SAM protein [Clostridia bacterium]|nr:radical SAM protein [Clostridia bacterium]
METKISRYLHAKGKRLGLPINGTFELTPRCNFNCKMCYVHLTESEQQKRGRELTADQWIKIGEDAIKAGTVFLLLTGGEPTLRPDFLEIFRTLKAMGLIVSINSNGMLLQGELFHALCEDPPSRINITLYGITNETYEKQCGLPAYDRVITNIKNLREAGIEVKVNMSVTPDNSDDLQAVYDKAKELGAHVQSTPYMFPPIRLHPELCGQNFRLPADEAGCMMAEHEFANSTEDQLKRRYDALDKGILLPSDRDEECLEEAEGEAMHCRGGVTTFWLDWDGKMAPCGQMSEPAFDVLKLGFNEAWQRTRAAAAAIRLPAECSVCPIKNICHPCAAMCYCETGNFNKKPEYVCKMRQSYIGRMQELRDERFGGR